MTRKERALRNLKQMCSDGRYLGSGSYIPLEVLEDFSTIIKALEQEPTTKNDLGVDCISREQALVAIRNLYPGMPRVDFNGSLRKWVDKYKPYIECDDAIEQLPSVTSQEPKIVSIAENKCDIDKLKELMNKAPLTTVIPQEPTTKNNLGVDCISRAEAIKTIQRYGVGCFDADEFSPEECERFVIAKLNELDSVTPQEPILDKIYADIQKLRGCSCSCSDGIIDDVEDILDKYKAEMEE